MHKKSRRYTYLMISFFLIAVIVIGSMWILSQKRRNTSGTITILRVNATEIEGVDYVYVWLQNQNTSKGDCSLILTFKANGSELENKKYPLGIINPNEIRAYKREIVFPGEFSEFRITPECNWQKR
jgi:hypothetical protein